MTQGIDSDARAKVEVLAALSVEQVRALAVAEHERRALVDGQHVLVERGDGLLCGGAGGRGEGVGRVEVLFGGLCALDWIDWGGAVSLAMGVQVQGVRGGGARGKEKRWRRRHEAGDTDEKIWMSEGCSHTRTTRAETHSCSHSAHGRRVAAREDAKGHSLYGLHSFLVDRVCWLVICPFRYWQS